MNKLHVIITANLILMHLLSASQHSMLALVDILPNASFTATTKHMNAFCDPHYVRVSCQNGNSWYSSTIDNTHNLQIQSITMHLGVNVNQYVTSYYVLYSLDGVNFINESNQHENTIFGYDFVLNETLIAKYGRVISINSFNERGFSRIATFDYDHPCPYIDDEWLLVRDFCISWHNVTHDDDPTIFCGESKDFDDESLSVCIRMFPCRCAVQIDQFLHVKSKQESKNVAWVRPNSVK